MYIPDDFLILSYCKELQLKSKQQINLKCTQGFGWIQYHSIAIENHHMGLTCK